MGLDLIRSNSSLSPDALREVSALIAPHLKPLDRILHREYAERFHLYGYKQAFGRVVNSRHDGTLDWLETYPDLVKWLHNSQSYSLWLRGGPGTGKSVIMAHLTEKVLPKFRLHGYDRSPTVLYSFCDEVVNNSASSMLATAIHQLLQKSDVRPTAFEFDNLQSLGAAKADLYPVSKLWRLMCQTVRRANLQPAFLILDDIDACEGSSRKEFFKLLASAQPEDEEPTIKVVISSCEHPALPGTASLRIDEMEAYLTHDMDRYCIDCIDSTTKGRSFDPKSKRDIFNYLRESKSATFLSLTLLLRKLLVTPRTALTEYMLLPVNTDGLYRHAIDNIPAESRPLCIQILRIILFTFKAFTEKQLYHATKLVGKSLNDFKFYDEQTFQNRFKKALRIMEPFLRTDFLVIEFVHSSAKTFLLDYFTLCASAKENTIFNVRQVHEDISIACLRLLLSSSNLQWPKFWHSASKGRSLRAKCLQSDPLLEYALGHWYKHLTRATSRLQKHQDMSPQLLVSAVDFVKLWEDPGRIDFRANVVRESKTALQISAQCRSPLDIFTALQIGVFIRYILDKRLESSRILAIRGSSESAIHKAIETGQFEVLGEIMEYFSITSLEGEAYRGILQKAAASGQPEVVRQVLKFRKRNPEELAHALNGAMAARSLGALEALAEEVGTFSEVDPIWQTNTLHRLFWHRTPENGDGPMAENLRLEISFLVQHEHVNAHSQDRIGNTALHYSCWMNWDSSVTQFLLDLGADPNTTNTFGWTALHLAAKYCHRHSNVEILLDRGGSALARSASRGGMTPLHWAAQRHDLSDYIYDDRVNGGSIVQSLLRAGGDALMPDARGRTPIDIAGAGRLYLFQSAYTILDNINTISVSYQDNTSASSRLAITGANDQNDDNDDYDVDDEDSDETESDLGGRTFFSAPSSRRTTEVMTG